jgi:hypothetical protein
MHEGRKNKRPHALHPHDDIMKRRGSAAVRRPISPIMRATPWSRTNNVMEWPACVTRHTLRCIACNTASLMSRIQIEVERATAAEPRRFMSSRATMHRVAAFPAFLTF